MCRFKTDRQTVDFIAKRRKMPLIWYLICCNKLNISVRNRDVNSTKFRSFLWSTTGQFRRWTLFRPNNRQTYLVCIPSDVQRVTYVRSTSIKRWRYLICLTTYNGFIVAICSSTGHFMKHYFLLEIILHKNIILLYILKHAILHISHAIWHSNLVY